jgi:hypothetical protein
MLGGWGYTYTEDNMLKTVKKNNGFMAQYFYDGDGKRVKSIENVGGSNVTTIYAYQGFNVLYEKTVENGTITKYQCANFFHREKALIGCESRMYLPDPTGVRVVS